MKSLEDCLKESEVFHGGECPGQVLGARMAMIGCREIGIVDPKSKEECKKIIVFVEMDRCASDAVMAVTGCRVGKRTVKIMDYGIMAATFVNLETGRAIRVRARESARELVSQFAPPVTGKYNQQKEAYKVMPEKGLFEIREVQVTIPEYDLPGPPSKRIQCEQCKDWVLDNRDACIGGKSLCQPCAFGGYFKRLN